MKILIYQPRVSYYTGGGEIYPLQTARFFAKLNQDVTILTTKASYIKYSDYFLQSIQQNPKWKYSLLISLFMGIRRGELAGLEWQDIDFENKTMKIQRSVQDIPRYGIITKEPKTENSKRVISMPDKLIANLKEYKEYWDRQKEYYGDRWKDNNRLFANEDG